MVNAPLDCVAAGVIVTGELVAAAVAAGALVTSAVAAGALVTAEVADGALVAVAAGPHADSKLKNTRMKRIEIYSTSSTSFFTLLPLP
jgi:hypothetical protein